MADTAILKTSSVSDNYLLSEQGLLMQLPVVGRRLVLTDFGINPTDEGIFREMYEQPSLVFWATRPTIDTPDAEVQELITNFYRQITEGDFRPLTDNGWTRRPDYRLAVRFKLPELYKGDLEEDALHQEIANPAQLPIVGYVSLNGLTLANLGSNTGPDMGTTIHPSFQGRGLATEMLALLAFHYLKHGIGNIYATRHPDNVGASKSQARSGFVDTGTSEVKLLTGTVEPRITSEMTLETFRRAPEWKKLEPFVCD